QAGDQSRDALIARLVDGIIDESTPAGAAAEELKSRLDEEALNALESGLDLPAGRSAYSARAMRRLTERMLQSEDDLHDARKSVFGVDDSWVPPSDPINAPIGHPAVDRVTKIVGRFLGAALAEWGAPARITLEHVRDAF